MDFKKLAAALGVFSIALGTAELLGSKPIARAFEAEGSRGLIKGFGAREVFAGVNLLAAPAVATNVWSRVAGDGMDLLALGIAARRRPANRAVWGSLAFVAVVTALDVFVARGLARQTGATFPRRRSIDAGPDEVHVDPPVSASIAA